MKTCPTCQKEFPDSMRFCQTDGTPLVDAAPKGEQPDPFKTVVGGSANPTSPSNDPFKTVVGGMPPKEDDLLQLPQEFDPMKTMVSSDVKPPAPSSSPFDAPKQDPFQKPEPEKPKSSEPSLNAPSFGDLSGSSSDKPADSPFSGNAPSFGSSPLPSESSSGSSPFDKPASDSFGSPFDKTPPPPYKSDAPGFGSQPQSFGAEQQNQGGQFSSPFDTPSYAEPQAPFGQQSNDPFNQGFQQNEWTPPPAPVQGWQDQGLGSNTPFTPPVAGAGGDDKTLAIVALVCGILSITCCGALTGIPALITGYMAKNNADNNPQQYGGRGMALAGMIMGGISLVFTVLYFIFVLMGGLMR